MESGNSPPTCLEREPRIDFLRTACGSRLRSKTDKRGCNQLRSLDSIHLRALFPLHLSPWLSTLTVGLAEASSDMILKQRSVASVVLWFACQRGFFRISFPSKYPSRSLVCAVW